MTKLSRRNFIMSGTIAAAGISILPESLNILEAGRAKGAKSQRWQIGCYTRPWAEYDYRVAFDGIAEAGFRYAGLMTSKSGTVITKDTTPEQALIVAEEAKSRGLQITSLYGGNFDVRKSINEGILGLKRLVDSTSICGCSNLLLAGIAEQTLVDNYYKVISECCDYGAAKGVVISVKPHGPLNSTGRECRPLIEKVGHSNFRLWYDPGNIYYYSDGKLSPVDDAAEVEGLVVGMSVKDFLMPKNVDVTPGTGIVDFPAVMKQLKKGGFRRGPLIVECLSKGDLSFVNSEARKARLFLEELIG